jgi:hypothetical protein
MSGPRFRASTAGQSQVLGFATRTRRLPGGDTDPRPRSYARRAPPGREPCGAIGGPWSGDQPVQDVVLGRHGRGTGQVRPGEIARRAKCTAPAPHLWLRRAHSAHPKRGPPGYLGATFGGLTAAAAMGPAGGLRAVSATPKTASPPRLPLSERRRTALRSVRTPVNGARSVGEVGSRH